MFTPLPEGFEINAELNLVHCIESSVVTHFILMDLKKMLYFKTPLGLHKRM